MKNRIGVIAAMLLAGNLPAAEIEFQNGLKSYEGTSDATLVGQRENQETLNYGSSATLEVAGVPHGGMKRMAVIRFADIVGPGRIPEGTTVVRAVLRLYKVGEPEGEQYARSEPNQLFLYAFPLLNGWEEGSGAGSPDEGGVTFAFRGYSTDSELQFWGEAQQPENGPVKGVDYASDRSARSPLLVGESDVWMEWNVTPLVQEWVNDPEKNHGFLIVARGFYIGSYFASSEAVEADTRPRLEVSY